MAVVALRASLPPAAAGTLQKDYDMDDECCWICLCGTGEADDKLKHLTRPCACPRLVHRECLATWQLINYGRREENYCRFCGDRLPQLWKPDSLQGMSPEELKVAPVMAVRYNGPDGTREFKMRVRPGPEGLAMFKSHLKAELGIAIGPEFDVTFECQMPATGSRVALSGLNAYGAATHCAALMAVKAASQPAAAAAASSAPVALLSAPAATTGSAPPCPLLPHPSSHATDASLCRRRACQMGYVAQASSSQPASSRTTGPSHAQCQPRGMQRSSSSGTRSWRRLHQGRDPGARRYGRGAGPHTALGYTGSVGTPLSLLARFGGRVADADAGSATNDLIDELLPYGPHESDTDEEEGCDEAGGGAGAGVGLAVSARDMARAHGTDPWVVTHGPRGSHDHGTSVSEPLRTFKGPFLSPALLAARSVSSGQVGWPSMRVGAGGMAALSAEEQQLPNAVPVEGGSDGSDGLPVVQLRRALEATPRGGGGNSGGRTEAPAAQPHEVPSREAEVVSPVGREFEERKVAAQASLAKQRLPTSLKAAAKSAALSFLRALRRGKD